MRKIEQGTRFKKDLKRYKNQPDKLKKLYEVVRMLAEGISLPAVLKPHKLIGNYTGYMECHVESDLLLLWIETNEEGDVVIILSCFGSHSDLF